MGVIFRDFCGFRTPELRRKLVKEFVFLNGRKEDFLSAAMLSKLSAMMFSGYLLRCCRGIGFGVLGNLYLILCCQDCRLRCCRVVRVLGI